MYQLEKKYQPVKETIIQFLEANKDYEDGSYGPLFVRLAWHASGTYVANHKIPGGICTAMLSLANKDPANNGLHIAVQKLEPIKEKYNWITYSDLYTLAGSVAIQHMGGPEIEWKSGRTDIKDKSLCPAHNRLPDAAQGSKHVNDVFCKAMQFSRQETVALIGCHVLGRCHTDRSGYDGKWVHNPISFRLLLKLKWTKREWEGPEQFEDESKELMMLPTDMALLEQPWLEYVELYAEDKQKFFTDFSKAFNKLIELGLPRDTPRL